MKKERVYALRPAKAEHDASRALARIKTFARAQTNNFQLRLAKGWDAFGACFTVITL